MFDEAIFNQDDQHGAKKSVSLEKNSEDLSISIYKMNGEERDVLKEYKTSGMGEWKEKYENLTDEPNVVLNFVASSVSIADLKEAFVNISLNISEIKEKVEYVEEEV